MNRLGLQAILRTVANSTASDGDLLGRFVNDRDEDSFRLLVERYGRLVWSVCRHLTRSDADADDAFQATFLVLSQRAASIRKPESLGSWLHGVALRICTKSRKSADKRTIREQAVSRSESHNGESQSSWDRAFAAVHEELGKLPETLRVPFVMCCLEGKGTSEAAAAVGWKLGTFSGRLTRAKDLLIARLDARGLTAGAVASTLIGVGASNAPASIVAKTVPLAFRASVIPRSILYLSQGVVEMNLHRIKLLAATVVLTCGLGTGVGTVMVANAQGLAPSQKKTETTTTDDGRVIQKERQKNAEAKEKALDERFQYKPGLQSNVQAAIDKAIDERSKQEKRSLLIENISANNDKWEYRFDRKPVGYAPTVERFQQTLKTAEKDGWEFVGQLNTAGETPDQPVLPTLVFRKPNPAIEKMMERREELRRRYADLKSNQLELDRFQDERAKRIAQLEAELKALKSETNEMVIRYFQKDLPIGVSELKDILGRVVPKVGLKPLKIEVREEEGGMISMIGEKASIDWAKRLIENMSSKAVEYNENPNRR